MRGIDKGHFQALKALDWPAILLSASSGLLLTAGFPKTEMPYSSWVALVPLFWALRGKSGREAMRLGFLCGLVHSATTLYWIRYVINHYGGLPLPVAVSILLLLCSYLAVYPACFAYVANRWESRPLSWLFGLPCVWVTLEWVRAHALTGFPWSNLGYTQTPFTWLIQVADITGVYGVSWLVVLGNTTLAALIFKRREFGKAAFFGALGFLACLAGVLAYGSQRIEVIDRLQSEAEPFVAAVVQGNIDQSLKWDPAFQQETLRRYRELSLEAAANDPAPDVVVWPETSAPFFFGLEEALTAQMNQIIRDVGRPVLFGSPGVAVLGGEPRLQNRAYLADSGASLLGYYAKQHLVPFGEYVPLKKLLFFVKRLVEAAGDFAAGDDPDPLYLGERRLGVLICYEGIFPYLARATVRQGADMLVNITNDAWYGPTSAPYQHLEIERWRAVELRLPLIRAANTGISAIFDSVGRKCGSIALGEQGYRVCTVRPFHVLTFYARWGDLFAWGCVLTALLSGLYSFYPVQKYCPAISDQ